MASSLLVPVGLLVAAALFLYGGKRMGGWQLRRGGGGTPAGAAAVQAAISGLLALLLAFTLSGAAARFDTRRMLIVDETNAIGTAYLRLDLLPSDARDALRLRFHTYLDSRIAVFRLLPDLAAAKAELARGQRLQGEIWSAAVAACRSTPSFTPAAILVLPALNQMIDLTTTRTMASYLHAPAAIFALLVLVLLSCAFFTGYGMVGAKRPGWPYAIGFLVLNVCVFSVIYDLEYPRRGFLREAAFDQALVELRSSWR